jgi:hypothetical protein
MLIFLACLFLVAVAIGSYVAIAIADTILGREGEHPAIGSPHTRL